MAKHPLRRLRALADKAATVAADLHKISQELESQGHAALPVPEEKPEKSQDCAWETGDFCTDFVTFYREKIAKPHELPMPNEKPSGMRRLHIMARQQDGSLTRDKWQELADIIGKSPHLLGVNGWQVNIDFVLRPSGLSKIMEGNYIRKASAEAQKPKGGYFPGPQVDSPPAAPPRPDENSGIPDDDIPF